MKINLDIVWQLTELSPKTYDLGSFQFVLTFIPKVVCVEEAQRVRSGGPGTVCAAEGTQ